MQNAEALDISKVKIRRGTRQQGGNWTFRAFYGSRRIGYLMIDPLPLDGHPSDERAPWKVSVVPVFQRKGIATKLYNAAEAWLGEQGLRLVPGLESPLHSVSDEAYRFWANRTPNHPAVLRDARRFEDQYSEKPLAYRGESWIVDHTAGREHFILRKEAGPQTKVVPAQIVWDVYGKPGEPRDAEMQSSEASTEAAA